RRRRERGLRLAGVGAVLRSAPAVPAGLGAGPLRLLGGLLHRGLRERQPVERRALPRLLPAGGRHRGPAGVGQRAPGARQRVDRPLRRAHGPRRRRRAGGPLRAAPGLRGLRGRGAQPGCGGLALIVGALWSWWRTRRAGVLLIGLGAMLPFAGGSLSDLLHADVRVLLQLLGIVVMFAGFLQGREVPSRAAVAVPEA